MPKIDDPLERLPWKARGPGDPVIVLTGAGASTGTGLPEARPLAQAVLRGLAHGWLPSCLSIKKIAESVPLETVFQAISENTGTSLIPQIIQELDSSVPSSVHRLVNNLGQQGLVRAIYTFNFDELHENAAPNTERCAASGFGRTIVKRLHFRNDNKVPLIKLHGCVSEVGTVTLSEYLSGFTVAVKRMIHADLKDGLWLVLGYGGWDLDFQQVIFNAVRRGVVPKEVIWVDRSFPDHGGRTDVLKLIERGGSLTVPLVEDLNHFCKGLTDFALAHARLKWNPRRVLTLTKSIERKTAAVIISVLSLHVEDVKYTRDVLNAAETVPGVGRLLTYLRARLEDQSSRRASALVLYRTAASRAPRSEQRLLSTVRLFALSHGSIDLFDQTDTKGCPEEAISLFNLVAKARRTDLGGLDRRMALRWLKRNALAIRGIKRASSLDLIRFYISSISEIARLFHEGEAFRKALYLDLFALQVSEALADPLYLGLVMGNVGACYMGLAESAPRKAAKQKLWLNADQFLTRAVQMPNLNRFSHSLHSANLGVVRHELGWTDEGIRLIRGALKELECLYPNYAVCFWGELARLYAAAAFVATPNRRGRLGREGVKALQHGLGLAEKLNDRDDMHFLKRGLAELKRVGAAPWPALEGIEHQIATRIPREARQLHKSR